LEGKYLDQATHLTATLAGASARLLPDGRTPTRLQAEVTLPADAPAGVYKMGLKSPAGESGQVAFTVDLFPRTDEKGPNGSPTTGQRVPLPVTVVGALGRAGEVDFFRFDAQPGQQVGVQAVTGAAGSKLDPVLELTDATGCVLAEGKDGVLGHTCAAGG